MICIAYEYAANGDLFNYIKFSGSLPLPIVKYYANQLIIGIIRMHKAGVCHRDLKLENLVLDSDFNLRIIDFGMACPLTGFENRGLCERGDRVGTKSYMAPEILLGY